MKKNNVQPSDGDLGGAEMVTVGASKGSPQELCELVAKKTKTYNPDAGEADAEFDTTEKIGWFGMIKRERSTNDFIKLVIGLITATLMGAALPGFCLVFGNMIDGVATTGSSDGDEDEFNALQKQSLWMIYIGCALFFIAMLQVTMLTQFGESIGFKTQVSYFQQAL